MIVLMVIVGAYVCWAFPYYVYLTLHPPKQDQPGSSGRRKF